MPSASEPPVPADFFPPRHLGSGAADETALLAALGQPSLDALVDAAVPAAIRGREPLRLPAPAGEHAALAELRAIAARNEVFRSFIGQGYADTFTPSVIQRAIFENPGWYTAYTPYQAEISQGRLEALLNYQTMVADLTGLEIANASMLDEGTAAAEAMTLCRRMNDGPGKTFFVSAACHPQTIDVVRTRARPLDLDVVVGDHRTFPVDGRVFGVLVQYPDTTGSVHDYAGFFAQAHAAGARCVVAADLLALTLLRPPGEFGADVAVGSAQLFGVPLGFGGPHAGYLATRDACKRQMPGRLVGVSRDAQGGPALRLALGTREQHIRRDKATSNICTAQVLLAVMASMYAVYHGPDGLRRLARRVHALTSALAAGLRRAGGAVNAEPVFDTLTVTGVEAAKLHAAAARKRMNLRRLDDRTVGVSLDETTTVDDVRALLAVFGAGGELELGPWNLEPEDIPAPLARTSPFLSHPVFNSYHTEHEMLRYIKRLEARDLSLCHSMISLGSCTMKLNAASEMLPLSWPEFGRMHPFAPADQTRGYQQLIADLETWLAAITGYAAISLQPNAGSNGEYAGLLAIRGYHEARGEGRRHVCLIPTSAHGTNPASAAMAGFTVVPVACDGQGNVDLADLRAKADQHAPDLAALMVTYPSTHGVFESGIKEIAAIVHAHGGQVYLDGANLNALVGLTTPAALGADVGHLNLHKTFCIPHGGGGPGAGPIGVARHLIPFLPGHSVVNPGREIPNPKPQIPNQGAAGASAAAGGSPLERGGAERRGVLGTGAVASAPWGSASLFVIPWMYLRLMGPDGLKRATATAILNANYVARRLDAYFPVLFKGAGGFVAHECIVDLREWKQHGVEVDDVAKRLMDYGYHAPTMSFPVPGTFMIEPTESESKAELDRFCDTLIAIHGEMRKVATGEFDKSNNPLKHAPHTAPVVCADAWDRPYSRELAAFPTAWTRAAKFWPAVGRVDNVYGDRHLVCSCPGL